MFISSNENRIKTLSVNEYFFLTENLEFADEAEIQSAMGFLITNKKNNLIKTVQSVIENELDKTERTVIKMYFYDGLDTAVIAQNCNIARSSVYRNIKSGLEKIEHSMKYVLQYDSYFSLLSANELRQCVKGVLN